MFCLYGMEGGIYMAYTAIVRVEDVKEEKQVDNKDIKQADASVL